MKDEGKWERRAVLFLIVLTAAIYVGSAGIPALLDDADSFYAEVAREINRRHDWITPYANTVRYLEKPPLFYWLISLSYAVLRAENAFTARLPTALAVTALVYVTFRIGKRLFGWRAGFFGGLALATSTGMFLFTRIILPDALFTLLLALLLYNFIRWEQDENKAGPLLWIYALAAVAVLAKGLIGVAFPGGIIVFTLVFTGRIRDVWRLVSWPGILLFFVIAAPWHLMVGVRNPGFFWFYFINEHVLRFLGKRYPMDYGTVPLVPFWLLHLVWLFPWSVYLLSLFSPANFKRTYREHQLGFVLLLAWGLTILLFFSLSSRLEYYTVPAFPALALLAGAQCASLWESKSRWPGLALAVLGILIGVALVTVTVTVTAGASEGWLKLKDNPDLYRYYLGHLFDLTPESLLALRTPLIIAGLGLGLFLPVHYFISWAELKAAVLALGMALFFIAANLGFIIFAPRLTSKVIADEINRRFSGEPVIVIDGEYEEGCSVAFYTRRPVVLHNGQSSNLEYGSRFPDAPPLFVNSDGLRKLWNEPGRHVLLVTFQAKQGQLKNILPTGHEVARYGDKVLLSNRAD
ncbi:MAG TPA: glycosyltransferase family 39 protein [Blastocatellia bacterium]|nr:glycosyltransferase family 39 protein [Blastocatellia bacterium]